MQLYHFDAHDEEGPLSTESAMLPYHVAARRHATQLAVSLAGRPAIVSRGEGLIVVQVYTAADGVVLTVRLVVGVETG